MAEQHKRRASDERLSWGKDVLKTFSIGDGLTLAFAVAMAAMSWGALRENQQHQNSQLMEIRARQAERDSLQDAMMREMKADVYTWMARIEGKLDRVIEHERLRVPSP